MLVMISRHVNSFVDSPQTFKTDLWGLVFLRDGRSLVVGHSHQVLLLREVSPGERWANTRIVTTIDVSAVCGHAKFSSLSLTSNDFEVSLIAEGIRYKINVESVESEDDDASPRSPSRQRDPIVLWRHQFVAKLWSLQDIAFDHSSSLLITSHSTSGVSTHKVCRFVTCALDVNRHHRKHSNTSPVHTV